MEQEPERELPEAIVVVPAWVQRRPDIRISRGFKRAAIAIAIASVVIPYATGAWIVFLPGWMLALIVLGVGRVRARTAAGVHRPGETAAAVAKQAVVVAGTAAASSVLMALLMGAVLAAIVGVAGAMFGDCRCDEYANSNFHIE